MRQLRESAGLKQKQAARMMGIRASVLSRYEKDERRPDLDMLVRLADFYGVTTDYLLGRNNALTSQNDSKEKLYREDDINPDRILILVANAEGREELRPVSPELEKSIKEAIKTAIQKRRRAIAEGKWPLVQKDRDESGNG